MSFSVYADNFAKPLAAPHVIGDGVLTLYPDDAAQLATLVAAAGFPPVGPDNPVRVTAIDRNAEGVIVARTRRAVYLATGLDEATGELSGLTAVEGTTDQKFFKGDVVAVLWTAGAVRELQAAVEDAAAGAATSYDPNATYVVEFAGGGEVGQPDANMNQCVNFGVFWRTGGYDLGTSFLWDLWIACLKSGYWWSDGYGGAHALLWGGLGPAGGPYSVGGNVQGTNAIYSFGGTYGAGQGEWWQPRVAWDGTNIFTYANGVPDGRAPLPNRRTINDGSGGGNGYMMGSDHINAGGRVAILRCFDRGQAVPGMPVVNGFPIAYVPERVMLPCAQSVPSDLYADMTRNTGRVVSDESPLGCVSDASGLRLRHPGVLFNNGGTAGFNPSRGTLPTRVADPTCPYGQDVGPVRPVEIVRTPGTPTPGALAGDTWGRANSTFAFDSTVTLGSTEYGSLGPLVWQTGKSAGAAPAHVGGLWGRLGGSAVYLDYGSAAAWVNVQTPDQDVRVNRGTGAWHSGETGLSFRVQDVNNRWLVYLIRESGGGFDWEYGYWLAGVWHNLGVAGGLDYNGAWGVLRAHAVGTSVTLQYGDGAAWTTLAAFDSTVLQDATGAGIATAGEDYYTSGLARYFDWKCLQG